MNTDFSCSSALSEKIVIAIATKQMLFADGYCEAWEAYIDTGTHAHKQTYSHT